MRRSGQLLHLLAAVCAGLALPPDHLAGQQKPTVEPGDYGRFETLGAARLSPDGRWIAYGVTRVDEKAELRIRRVDRDSTRAAAWGSDPVYSANSRWLAWSVGISPDERKQLDQEKKPVRTGAGLLDLTSDTERTFATIRTLAFDGLEAETGRVAAGFRADLILTAKDPLADWRTLRDPEMVVVGGRGYTREELGRMLRSVAATP